MGIIWLSFDVIRIILRFLCVYGNETMAMGNRAHVSTLERVSIYGVGCVADVRTYLILVV